MTTMIMILFKGHYLVERLLGITSPSNYEVFMVYLLPYCCAIFLCQLGREIKIIITESQISMTEVI